MPHPCRVLCDRVGILILGEQPQKCTPKVNIPTLSLQKTQGQGWGTLSFSGFLLTNRFAQFGYDFLRCLDGGGVLVHVE